MEITKADLTRAKQALARALEAERMLEENRACGLVCEEADLQCQDAKKFLTAFLQINEGKPLPR